MTELLLSLRVLAAVLAIGPATAAASMFPRALRRAHIAPADREALASLRPNSGDSARRSASVSLSAPDRITGSR
ncbi:hypothetical protein ACWD04_24590 [Streptomyces sp. NPDC002911]